MSDNAQIGKRKPPTELDYEAFRKGDFSEKGVREHEDVGKINTEEEIAARKILKIRRGGAYPSEGECKEAENNAKARFTLGQALPTSNNTTNPQAQAPVSFISKAQETDKPNFSNNNQNSTSGTSNVGIFNFDGKQNIKSMFNNNSSTKVAPKEDEQKAQQAGFFGNAAPAQQQSLFQPTSNVFVKKDETALGNKAKTGLSIFNTAPATGGGLFGNAAKKEESPKKQSGLFGAKVEPKSGGGLFGNKSSDSQPKSGGLFGNLQAPSSNIFAKADGTQPASTIFGTVFVPEEEQAKPAPKPEPKATGLFANLSASIPKDSLFSGLADLNKNSQAPSSMLFSGNISNSFLKNPENNEQNGEEGSNDEEEDDQNEKEEVIDKTKSTGNYKYEELCEILYNLDLVNFKVNDSAPYGKGKVSIEKVKASGQHMLVFRNPAQLIIFSGYLIKKLTYSDYMKGKSDAMFVISYAMEKVGEDENAKPTPVRKNCKMAFNTNEDAKTLVNFVQENFKE